MSIAEIIAVIAGVGALIGTIAGALKQRADSILTAKREETDALLKTINEIQERNTLLYGRVSNLEEALEKERCKRRDLEAVVMAKDTRIAELESKVAILETQLEELEQTPKTRRKAGNTAP